jgi:hypothetical protein
MNLGDRVLGPASGPEPVRARLKVGLEDRLQHQLEGGLHDPVADRRDPQPAQPAAALGDQTLLHRRRPEAPGAQLLSEPCQEPLDTQPAFDVVGVLPIHPGRARPSIGPHPLPRHHQRGRVTDEVVEVGEPPLPIVSCPPVQLALDPEYPRLSHVGLRPRRGAIQRPPPRLPDGRRKSAASLRHATGFPDLGLHLPVSLAGPRPSGSTGPSRRCRGCSRPRPALPRPGCPQLQRPAATGRRWIPHSTRSLDASWRTTCSQHNRGKSQGRPKKRSPGSQPIVQNGLPDRVLPGRPPSRSTDPRPEPGQQPSKIDFHAPRRVALSHQVWAQADARFPSASGRPTSVGDVGQRS